MFGGWRRNPWAQPIGGRFIRGGRGRNLWRNQQEAGLVAAAEAQPMAQPIGGRFSRGGRGRNLWRNQ